MYIREIILTLICLAFLAALYPLKNYQLKAHLRALKKSGFILALSALPAFGILLVKGDKSSILYGELFIYSATYLAPVLYWFYERATGDSGNGKKIKGDWFTFVIAVFILVVTPMFFIAFKLESKLFIEDYPFITPWLILGITIVLWHSIIAFEENAKDFVSNSRIQEKTFLEEVTK